MAQTHIYDSLNTAQSDGLACIECCTDYLTASTPHVPVGRSLTGSQVFACVGTCAEIAVSAR